MSEVTIKAVFDCLITKSVKDKDGDIVKRMPTTKHYIFKGKDNEVVGGLYIKDEIEVPERVVIEIK